MDELLADFLAETNESLGDIDDALIKLERAPDDKETLSLIFRLVHTIKGTCGFLGLPRLEATAHAAENVLGRVRDGKLAVTGGLVTAVLAAIDRIKLIVSGLAATGEEAAGDDSALIAELNAIADGETPAPAALPEPAPEPEAGDLPVAEPAGLDTIWRAAAEAPQAMAAAPAAPPDPPAAEAQAAQTIRVAVDVLEDLMTLVSELVLSRNQLMQLARSHEDALGAFTAPLQRLSHITSELQEGVMKTRMQPIGNAWNKLPRLVRDLSLELGKKIELTMIGAETELDRQVLELIKDPLTHMVRNSADHGLETPEQRRRAGKPDTGQITLNALHEGGHILIEISDDGRGLPADRIRAKVLANGLAAEAELAAMSEGQIYRFVFHPGFSTAEKVTSISGRGVGMDVVKTNIERIGGTIDLTSTPGRGTSFTIKIPLTLAIVSALIVEAARERFAIPQISVVELVRAAMRRPAGGQDAAGAGVPAVETIDGTPVLRLRNRLLPLVYLDRLLCLPGAAEALPDVTIVVVQVGSAMLGLVVDRVFDTEEIVVKPVAPILRHITMFSGNTILGDGSVIMILDPNGIARASGMSTSTSRAAISDAAKGQGGVARTAFLLFRAGSEQPMAVPLGLVARLEDIPLDRIETSCGQPVTQYRGRLMPLVALAAPHTGRASQPILVFTDQNRTMGLMVDTIVDVIEDVMTIEVASSRPGLLGSCVIAGKATDIIDTGYWLRQAGEDWFRIEPQTRRLLIVEDSAFFRHMILPVLRSAGYEADVAADAAEALQLRDSGTMFDIIVSDIEMPGMDGIAFAREVRRQGPWTHLPLIALSGRAEPPLVAAARDAGFTDFVAKFDRGGLLSSLAECVLDRFSPAA